MSGPFYEPGYYDARVVSQAFQKSKKGNPMIVLKVKPLIRVDAFRNADGSMSEDRYPVTTSYERTIYLGMNPENEASLDVTLQKLRAAGFDGDDFADLDLIDREVRCVCEHAPYNNEQREQWSLPLPEREVTELDNDPSMTRTLNALFGKKLKEGANLAAKSRNIPVDTTGETLTDEDIPFAWVALIPLVGMFLNA